MMTRYIALLRAINIGGHVVKMDYLRRQFESLGLLKVQTYIASGNVIFESGARNPQALEKKITAHLHEVLGYEVATFIRTAAELLEIAEYEPFTAASPAEHTGSLYIGFATRALDEPARQAVLACHSPVDDFNVRGREIYWLCRVMSSESAFSPGRLERTLGMPLTFRNSTTVRKLASLARLAY
jgi:uncharacterized protein (DUF1697 family)